MRKQAIDKTPARLDFLQSATGLILALFIMQGMTVLRKGYLQGRKILLWKKRNNFLVIDNNCFNGFTQLDKLIANSLYGRLL